MATLGDLVVKLSMDAAGFTSDAGRAAFAAEKMSTRIVAAGNVAAQAIIGIAKTFASMAKEAATALPSIADNVAEQVDALNESAEAAQITAEAYQTLQVAAQDAGVGAEVFDAGLKKLNQSISDAGENADGKAGEAFRRLGISVRDAQGNLKNAAQVLDELDKRFDTLPDGPDKVAIAVELMGKAGQKFIPALNADLAAMQETAKATGQVFSQELTKGAEDYKAALLDLHGAQQALSNQIAEQMLVPMSEAVKVLDEFVRALTVAANESDKITATSAQEFFRSIATAAAFTVDVFVTLVDMTKSVGEALALLVFSAVQATEALGHLADLDLSSAKQSIANIEVAIDEFKLRQQARLNREPLRVKLEAEFAAADARRAQQAAEAALKRSAPDFSGSRPLEPPSAKAGKTKRPGIDQAARDAKEAALARIHADQEASEEALRNAEKEAERIEKLKEKTAAFQLKIDMEQAEEEERIAKDALDQIDAHFEDMAEERRRVNEQMSADLVDPLLEFVRGTETASEAFSDFIGNITSSLQQMAAKGLADQIFGSLFQESGGAGGLVQQLFGSGFSGGGGSSLLDIEDLIAFGGGFAAGGSFLPNKMIRVGERGPEMLFTGPHSGRIEPGVADGAQTTNNLNVSVNVPAQTDRRTADQIAAQVGVAVGRAMRRIQ